MRTSSVLGALTGMALGLGAVGLIGCVYVQGSGISPAAHKETRTVQVPHTGPVALEVSGDNGRIEVVRTTGSQITVTAKVATTTAERLTLTNIRIDQSKDTLRIYAEWPEQNRLANERCAFEVAIPEVTSVHLTTSNGAIELEGLTGAAILETSNGAIEVEDHVGPVTASTTNGRVELEGVDSATVTTSNGAVEIELSEGAAGPVNAQTSNGAIKLVVGPAFRGEVDASTSNGSIRNHASAVAVGTPSRNRAKFAFGTGGGTSTLETSNGSITLDSRN